MVSRPRRKATNAHVFRYYYATSKRLEEKDLKRALEASLEECPDSYWLEDTASCSSSEQGNANSAISSVSSSSTTTASTSSSNGVNVKRRFQTLNATEAATVNATTKSAKSGSSLANTTKRRITSASMQKTHQNNHNHAMSLNSNCPKSNVHYRYKPVAKKNIYYEADFFHEGIMEYIDYELNKLRQIETNKKTSTTNT